METAEQLIERMRAWRGYTVLMRALADDIQRNPRPVHPPPAPAGLTGLEWWISINCDDCDCAELEATLADQVDVVRGLLAYTNFTLPTPPHVPFANAAGFRGAGYRSASNCLQRVIDEMESPAQYVRFVLPWLGAFVLTPLEGTEAVRREWRTTELYRSRQFIEFLKAVFWWCCGDQAYAELIERLSSGRLRRAD